MQINSFRIKILLLAISALSVDGARKYDIEEEALSIYGTDLKSVLRKFRHSPEYLKILEERSEQIAIQLSSMVNQLAFYFTNEMKTNIVKILKPGEDVDKVKRHLLLRSKYNPLRTGLRQEEEQEQVLKAKDEEVTRAPNEILDDYVAKSRKLPANFLNHFRGMGYEYFGRVLHGLITNLGGNFANTEARFTQGGDGPLGETTTEHVTLHTVTTPPDMTPFITQFPSDGEGETYPQTVPPPAHTPEDNQ